MTNPLWNADDLTHRLVGFRKDMERLFTGRTLTCLACGATQPAQGDMVMTGWPECCGYTMRLGGDA